MSCVPCALLALGADGPSLTQLLADARPGQVHAHDCATHGADATPSPKRSPMRNCPACHAAAVALAADADFVAVAQRYPGIRMALCPTCRSGSPKVYGDDDDDGSGGDPGASDPGPGSQTAPDASSTNTDASGNSIPAGSTANGASSSTPAGLGLGLGNIGSDATAAGNALSSVLALGQKLGFLPGAQKAPVISTPANGSTQTTPVITGAAPPGGAVSVTIDGSPAGSATASSSGVWTFSPKTPIAAGPHTVSASNSTGTSATVSFTLVPPAKIAAAGSLGGFAFTWPVVLAIGVALLAVVYFVTLPPKKPRQAEGAGDSTLTPDDDASWS